MSAIIVGPRFCAVGYRFRLKADSMPGRFSGFLPEDVWPMIDRSMSFVEPYLTLSLGHRLGPKEILKVSKPLFCSDS